MQEYNFSLKALTQLRLQDAFASVFANTDAIASVFANTDTIASVFAYQAQGTYTQGMNTDAITSVFINIDANAST